MWLIVLSDQLPVVALVSRYLTNKLIGREPIQKCQVRRSPAFIATGGPVGSHTVLIRLSAGYPLLLGRLLT